MDRPTANEIAERHAELLAQFLMDCWADAVADIPADLQKSIGEVLADISQQDDARQLTSVLTASIGPRLVRAIIAAAGEIVDRNQLAAWIADTPNRLAVEKDARDAERREGVA